jgi:hypothetical protein
MTNYKNILIIGLTIIIAILITYIAYNNMPDLVAENKELRADNRVLQQEVNDLSFQYTTAKLANDGLRLDMADRELEIISLQAHKMAYEDMTTLLEYSLSYINVLQIRLQQAGDYGYPEFIVRAVVRDIITEGIKEE